jgi:hypothetical protein
MTEREGNGKGAWGVVEATARRQKQANHTGLNKERG